MTDPDTRALVQQLRSEGLDVTEWEDEPGTTYAEHAHAAREVRLVLEGGMTIVVDGQARDLGPGDRIDLDPDEPHSAVVGPRGCRYLAGTQR